MYNAFQVYFFGSHQWKAFLQIKPHLVTETTLCTCAGAVSFFSAIIQYMLKERKILLHGCKLKKSMLTYTVMYLLWGNCGLIFLKLIYADSCRFRS